MKIPSVHLDLESVLGHIINSIHVVLNYAWNCIELERAVQQSSFKYLYLAWIWDDTAHMHVIKDTLSSI